YTSDLLDRVKAKVEAMMDGGIGLEPVMDALVQRGRARLDVEVQRAIDTGTDEFASRGFPEPNGPLALAIDDVVQRGTEANAAVDGGLGLGPVMHALFQRGRARLDVEVARAVDTRTDEFASRGFSEPNGILALAIDDIVQGGIEAKPALNNEITIEEYRELVN